MRFFRSRARPAGSPDAVPPPTEPSGQRSKVPDASPADSASALGERSEPEPAPAPPPDETPGPVLEPEREPERESPSDPAPPETPPEQPRVVGLTARSLGVPRQWNIWELERVARAQSGTDAARDEERSFLLMYLREFADADGVLPTSFDTIVRESFGDVLDAVGA